MIGLAVGDHSIAGSMPLVYFKCASCLKLYMHVLDINHDELY